MNSRYVYASNIAEAEQARLARFEAWADPYTVRRIARIPISAGWHCLDVGAGRGSVAKLLACLVGPSGAVVATDIDTQFLTDLPENVEVRCHDITTSELEPSSFDFVHCRALLMHLQDPARAMLQMLSALKPGGWFLFEEADWGFCTIAGHPRGRWATDYLHDLFARHVKARIRHPYFGRTLPGFAADFGFTALEGDVAASVIHDGDAELELIRLTVEALRPASIATGAAPRDLDQLNAILADARVVGVGIASTAVWGQKSP